MSKQSEDALAAIERLVFQSTGPIVVALVGGWGEGKTYFWREEVIKRRPEAKTGYVSVFGAESIAVIRERVALASSRLADMAEGGGVPDWLQKIGAPVVGAIGRAAKFWGGKVGVTDTIAVELLQSFGLKPGWIVCIDDVERLSDSVGFENFLGYVSELRDKWKLKVVLIYNREPIDADQESPFHIYQEKVIDRSLPFSLDLRHAVELAFGNLGIPDYDAVSEAFSKSEVLGLRNIRLLAKARSYFNDIVQVVGVDADKEFLTAALGSLLLFTYTKYSNQKPEGLSFELIAKHSEWNDRFRAAAGLPKKGQEDKGQSEAKELLGRYGYIAASDLSRLFLRFVQTDLLDVDSLRATYSQYLREFNARELEIKFREIWSKLYHGNLTDNSNELCDAIEAALSPYMPHISPGELDYALVVLSELGRTSLAVQFFEQFKKTRGATFENLELDSMPTGNYAFPPLRKYLVGIANSKRVDVRTIAEVIEEVFKQGFVSPKDGDRLAAFSVNDLTQYLTSLSQPKLTSKIKLLTKSGHGDLERKATAAVKKIARTNPLNRMRMEGMGLVQPKKSGKHKGP